VSQNHYHKPKTRVTETVQQKTMGAFTDERDTELVLWFARRKKEKAKAAAEEIEAEKAAASEDALYQSYPMWCDEM
jgi:hypothetical protein